LAERHSLERAAKEKRAFFRDTHSDCVDSFDGSNFAVGQVFCAEAAGEFSADQQDGDNRASGGNSGDGFRFFR
jgi:hypothetical protein